MYYSKSTGLSKLQKVYVSKHFTTFIGFILVHLGQNIIGFKKIL